jgi:hypothetical protein
LPTLPPGSALSFILANKAINNKSQIWDNLGREIPGPDKAEEG